MNFITILGLACNLFAFLAIGRRASFEEMSDDNYVDFAITVPSAMDETLYVHIVSQKKFTSGLWEKYLNSVCIGALEKCQIMIYCLQYNYDL